MTRFLLLLTVASVSSQRIDDDIDNAIYDVLHKELGQPEYNFTEEKAACIGQYLKTKGILEKFYVPEMLFNTQRLMTEVEPYLREARSNCGEKIPAEESSLIALIITIVVSIVLLLISIGIFLCCRSKNKDRTGLTHLADQEIALRGHSA